MGLYVTYMDCMECEDKECKEVKKEVKKTYLAVDIGSIVYLVFAAKKLGYKDNVVVKCKVDKATVYEDKTIYSCEPIKIVTKIKDKQNVKNWVNTFMFENTNIDTGYKSRAVNRYPVFTSKEKCIEWIRK